MSGLRASLRRIAVALLLAVLVGLAPSGAARADGNGVVTIRSNDGSHPFTVEIVDTPASREHGLMGRRMLPADRGMLFDFVVTEPVYFWMKDTPIPLDMIFIRRDLTISRIEHSATPFSERVIPSGGPVRYVLEVPGRTANRLGIVAGDRIAISADP